MQALNDQDLRRLGRLHDVDQALGAIGLAREIFPRLSFDLIYARPVRASRTGKPSSRAGHRARRRPSLALPADHRGGTAFHALHKAGKLTVPDGELSAELYEATQAITRAHGLPAYEISNHAVPGAESRHNLTYWRYGLYAGVGPGAHARLPGPDGTRHAVSNEKHPETWLRMVEDWDAGHIEDVPLEPQEQADELMLMGLRLVEGMDLRRWRDLSGATSTPRRSASSPVTAWSSASDPTASARRPTGMLVLDAVVADLA